jgi:hypothetical protein
MRTLFVSAVLVQLVYLLSGCGGNANSTPVTHPHVQALQITSTSLPTGSAQAPYGGSTGIVLTALGGVSPYAWNWTAQAGSSLAQGLSLSTAGVITGIPAAVGSYSLAVTVTDAETPPRTSTALFTLVIESQPQSSLMITSGAPPNGADGVLYDATRVRCYWPNMQGCTCVYGGDRPYCTKVTSSGFVLSASGGKSPYNWSWVAAQGSSLPPGLNLSPDGKISGTPENGDGNFQVIVTLTDSESPDEQARASYTIFIAGPPPPGITPSPAPPAGAVNHPYDFLFSGGGGFPPYVWSESGALPPGLAFTSNGELSGTPTATGTYTIILDMKDSTGQTAPPATVTIGIYAHGFSALENMTAARASHTETVLPNGKVLLIGGGTATAEIFDPNSESFSATGSMETVRNQHTATLLQNGKVLVTGGTDAGGEVLATAELFDPATNTFTATSNMEIGRFFHAAVQLADGRVLVTGGTDSSGAVLSPAEVFDPKTNTFTATNDMSVGRYAHTITLLTTGKVLLTGGLTSTGFATATAEIFDPTSGGFTSTGAMPVAVYEHVATLLNDGSVLITGGQLLNPTINGFFGAASAELFDPTTARFSSTHDMNSAHASHIAAILDDGRVLVAGGADANNTTSSAAEVFDPATGTFSPTGSMITPRYFHAAVRLNDGRVLVTGGLDSNGQALDSAEFYQ